MNLRSFAFALMGLVIGAASVMAWNQYRHSEALLIQHHWGIVDHFNETMRGESSKYDSVQGGLFLTECPVDPNPSLAFLVSKSELRHTELIFPNVENSRFNNLVWLEFTNTHFPDIVWATGHSNNSQLGSLGTDRLRGSGEIPLIIDVWYKNSDRATELVKELVMLTEAAGVANRGLASKGACDFQGFVESVKEFQAIRKERLLTAQQFATLCKDSNVVILDARGESDYEVLHVKGSKNLPFTSIGYKSLREMIPETNTQILIYCRNNLMNAAVQNLVPYIEKSAAGGLNIPTAVTLYGYGYQNVWELDEVVDPSNSPIEFVRAD